MTALQILQSAFIWALIWVPARLLGGYMARVYEGNLNIPVLGALERWLYRLSRVRPDEDMPFSTYAGAVLLSNVFGAIAVYVILRIQGNLPLNPAGFGAVAPHVALNTAVSFATNTNWQAYGGETTLSQLTQMLGLAAVACVLPAGTEALGNPGAHGFSEILYAFSSGANNNGSAFGGLTVNGHFYTVAITLSMLVGRYWVIIPVLAIAGSLARKRAIPLSVGTLPTHTPIFLGLIVAAVFLMGALTFIPALALGPLVEHLLLSAR